MSSTPGRRWFLRAAVLAATTMTCVVPFRFVTAKRRAYNRFLKDGDHRALMAACQDLMKRHAEFRDGRDSGSPTESVPVENTDPRLPALIRELTPTTVFVAADSVRIEMHGGHDHFGFKAYADVGANTSDRELVPGLFAY